MQVRTAETQSDWQMFETLVREYLDELPFVIDFQDVDDELSDLSNRYSPPRGQAFLVALDGTDVGAVGLAHIGDGDSEMKRMFVRPPARGMGAGRVLADCVITAARKSGSGRILLDTVESLDAAIALYESLGFTPTDPYRYNPRADARFYALDLTGQAR